MIFGQTYFDLIGFAAVGLIVLAFLINFIRFGGFKGAVFNASILKTLGEIAGHNQFGGKKLLRVYALENSEGDPLVGLEIRARFFLSFQLDFINLEPKQAKLLIELLEKAN